MRRSCNWIYILLIIVLVGFAYYLEYVKGLAPCPLCVIQRFLFILLGVLFLLSAIVNFRRISQKILAVFTFLFSLLGVVASGRQVWLQHVPSDQPQACIPNLHTILNSIPFKDALILIFQGGSDCAEKQWQWLGLSIADWSLIFFVLFLFISFYRLMRR